MEKLNYIVKFNNPQQKYEQLIVWLHGLGADCNNLVPLTQELKLKQPTKFIFPNAPMRPISINGGCVMRGWYDILNTNNIERDIDLNGIYQSIAQLEQLINVELSLSIDTENPISSKDIILAGFSQGGVLSYYQGICSSHKFKGIIALSAYLVKDDEFMQQAQKKASQLNIFAAHGLQDIVVPYIAGEIAYKSLANLGAKIEWHNYQMEHNIITTEINDIERWINALI